MKLGLQRKLTIGASNDPLEQEADRVAEAVVSGRSVATNPRTGPPAVQRQEAPEKPREQPTKFPAQELPKEGQAKEDDDKEKLKKGGLAAAGKLGEFLWDQFSNSEEGKRILDANERDLKPILNFFKDFADTIFGKIVLGAAGGGAAAGAFAAAQSGRDTSSGPEISPSTGGPVPRAPKDEKFFGLELKWDFISPPTGVTLKTPWLDSPKIPLGPKPPAATSALPAPPVLFKMVPKIPRICTSADPQGDQGEADARSAFIFWWLQRNRQMAEKRQQELLDKSKLHEPPKYAPTVKPLFKREPGGETVPDPQAIEAGLRSPGQPLDPATRAFMEPRFGHDLSQVRVHTDLKAAESARALNAMAYTFGRDVVFAAGRYSPTTLSGTRLLAHELAHTIQQTAETTIARPLPATAEGNRFGDDNELEADRMAGIVFGEDRSRRDDGGHFPACDLGQPIKRAGALDVIQRQEAGQNTRISARTVFPFPEKSRLLVTLLLTDDLFKALEEQTKDDPDYTLPVRIFRASNDKIATVTIASDDVFEAVIPSIDLPAKGGSPAQTVKDVVLRFLRRSDGNFFKFEMWAGGKRLYGKKDLAAQKSGDEINLEPPDGAVKATIGPVSKSGQLEIVGDTPIGPIPVLQLTRRTDEPLADAPVATEGQKRFVQQVSDQQVSQEGATRRREPRQEITLGAGVQVGAKLDPVLATSWRISFNPSVKTAGIVQIPLRVDIEYAPNKSVLGGVSSGAAIALPTKFPLNVRVVGGVAGGTIEGAAPGGGKPPLLPAFGPTLGAGIGFGGKTFRVEVDYQHLQNLVRSSPNVDTVLLSGGVKF